MPFALSVRMMRPLMLMLMLLMSCCFMAERSVLADHDNLSVSSASNTENIKIGNTKTNNYNMQNNHFLPTQLTQVVLNVPKIGKKLRRTRQPTIEEMAIREKILEIYERARRETSQSYSIHLEHLGRIIKALNPKYIATERVRRVAFADPRDPNSLIPLPEFNPIQVELDLAGGSPLDKLNLLAAKFNELVRWDENIVEEFSSLPDESLEPSQAALKRVILCLSGHPLCNQQQRQLPVDALPAVEEPAEPVVAASRNPGQRDQMEAQPSYANEVYMAPPSPQQPYQQPPPRHTQSGYAQVPVRFQQAMQPAPQEAPIQRPRQQIPEAIRQRYLMKQRNRPK